MYNPYLNASDANDSAIANDQQVPQSSNPDQPLSLPSPSTTRRNEKHVLYMDDYTTEEDNPPSYSIAQSSDVDMRAPVRRFSESAPEVIPLDPYHAHSSSEPETAPLMEPDFDEHTPPTAPSIDQIEISLYNPFDRSKRVRQCSVTRGILGFAIFVVGVILMATALATIKCYSDGCDNDANCDRCQNKTHKGFMAAGFSFFILTSLCIIWKFIKYALL
ncbi:unnamed protein product [Mucor circinelloides]